MVTDTRQRGMVKARQQASFAFELFPQALVSE